MYVKLYNYYWYVKGKDFFIFYEKFEELYNEMVIYIDDLVECFLVLDGKLIVIMKEFLEMVFVKEVVGNEMVE